MEIPEVCVEAPDDDDGVEFNPYEHGVTHEQRAPSDSLTLPVPQLHHSRSASSAITEASTFVEMGSSAECSPNESKDEPPSDVEKGETTSEPWFVLPMNAVLGSASIGLLAFLNTGKGGAQTVSGT